MNKFEDEIKNSIELESIDTNKDTSEDKKVSLLSKSQIYKITKQSIKENQKNLLFGNDFNILRPRRLGKMWAFLYYKENPLIVIGPDCK